MVTPGEILPLTIEKPAAGGRMIARVDGQVVLVSGAIPGERVIGRVERVGRGVAYAEVVTLEAASPDRREALADPLCGGCLYAHITYERQLSVKALVIEDAFARIGHLALPQPVRVTGSPEDGYRMRARLHVRGGHIGFFREGTHDLCDPRGTRQLRDDTCDTLEQLGAGLRSLGMKDVRDLELSENVDASQRVVHLEAQARTATAALKRLGTSTGLTGLSVAGPTAERGKIELLAGDPHVIDVLDIEGRAVTLRRHVLAFFQANRFLLPSLVSHVMAQIADGQRVLDLYAGTGLFSVAAAITRSAQVTAVEGDRAGAIDLAANAHSAGTLVTAVHAPVEDYVAGAQSGACDVLILDPPRTGLSNAALEGALALAPPTIVYVSCDVATLARDARKVVAAGYTLESLTGFDLFPNTPHVESVVVFRR
jgi:23S rRNA (uracil1939-C5)-methyltransferase